MRVYLLVGLLVLAACQPTALPAPYTPWGEVVTVGNAEQTQAPAYAVDPQRLTFAWVQAAADGANLEFPIRALDGGRFSPAVMLPLAPRYARDLRLSPGTSKAVHLLWLDAADNPTPQLFNALVDETLGLFRGPIQVSEGGARCYDLLAEGEGVWVMWSGGPPAAPMLYTALIDATGRPLRVQPVLQIAGCPVAAQTFNRQVLLLYGEGRLQMLDFLRGQVGRPVSLVDSPTLAPGDWLRGVRAGSDGERLYAFWNITRADGAHEVWFSYGLPGGAPWPAPQRLAFALDVETPYETSFNTGPGVAALNAPPDAAVSVAWAGPARNVTGVLPVAVVRGGTELGVVYLRDGRVEGYQAVTALQRPLLAPPELQFDRDRHQYLSWSQPTDIAAALLQTAATRPLLR